MSKPKEFSSMTKDKLMTYTLIALSVLAAVTAILWSGIGTEKLIATGSGWNLGLTLAINCLIAVGVAVGIDALLHKVTADSKLNLMSATVFGLVVALSYSLGIPTMRSVDLLPLEAPDAFLYVAFISMIGMVLFKKIVGLSGRKYVNPAAAAKLVVLIPFLNTLLLVKEHLTISLMGGSFPVPPLAGPISHEIIGNYAASFGSYVQGCFVNPTISAFPSVDWILLITKFHGWPGGASSIAVIIVGLGLFIVARRYIKWRITLAYLVTVTVMSLILTAIYGGEALMRIEFELFIGSSIFLAFFMATDPATTPLTYAGQAIFGTGLGVLTVLIQTYMNFFGGSILALIIMNLTSPALDKIGKLKPITEKRTLKLPKAKQFPAEKVKEYPCIRCGACMRVCCHKLSPILLKEAFDKTNIDALVKLQNNLCDGCGHCTFVCPARIDLRASILKSKAMTRPQ